MVDALAVQWATAFHFLHSIRGTADNSSRRDFTDIDTESLDKETAVSVFQCSYFNLFDQLIKTEVSHLSFICMLT